MIQRAWNSDKPSAPNNSDPLPPPPPLLMASGHSFCSCGDSFLSAQTEPVFSKRHRQMVTIPPPCLCATQTQYMRAACPPLLFVLGDVCLCHWILFWTFFSSLLYDFCSFYLKETIFIPTQTHFITANLLVGGVPQREKCPQSIS